MLDACLVKSPITFRQIFNNGTEIGRCWPSLKLTHERIKLDSDEFDKQGKLFHGQKTGLCLLQKQPHVEEEVARELKELYKDKKKLCIEAFELIRVIKIQFFGLLAEAPAA